MGLPALTLRFFTLRLTVHPVTLKGRSDLFIMETLWWVIQAHRERTALGATGMGLFQKRFLRELCSR